VSTPGRRAERVGAADEDQFGLGMGGEKRATGRQGRGRAVVTAHAVDGQAYRPGRNCHVNAHAAHPPTRAPGLA